MRDKGLMTTISGTRIEGQGLRDKGLVTMIKRQGLRDKG
jgi:hypothetical protein